MAEMDISEHMVSFDRVLFNRVLLALRGKNRKLFGANNQQIEVLNHFILVNLNDRL